MAGGIPLQNLTDLFRATSQAVLTAENYLLNETQLRTSLLRKVMRSHDMEDMIQGGDKITDFVIFDEDDTSSDYQPMESFTPRLGNHLTELSIDWKFTQINVTFSKHEKGLNMASQLKKGARAMVFKRIIKAKWSNVFISLNKRFERHFFTKPSAATMETEGGKTPMSMFATIHEFGAVLTDQKPTATVPPGFTTIQSVNPTTQPKWRNPVQGYSDGIPDILGPAAAVGNPQRWDGFRGMRKLYDRMHFEELAIRPEHGEPSEAEGFIMCSLVGKELWETATARQNDHLRHGKSNAAYPGLNYEGVPLNYIEFMDFAEVWSDVAGTGFAGEFDTSVGESGEALANPLFEGPRFVLVVPKYWRKIVHSTHFLEEEAPPATVFQPFSRTIYYDNWHNNFCRSRQRAGGVLTPTADIIVA